MLWYLINSDCGDICNTIDDELPLPQGVVAYAVHLMGIEAQLEILYTTIQLSPTIRSFYGEQQHVAHSEIRAMSYDFSFHNCRAAFDRM